MFEFSIFDGSGSGSSAFDDGLWELDGLSSSVLDFGLLGCVDIFHRSHCEAIVGDYPRCLAGDIGPGAVRDFVHHRETLQ